MARPFKSVNPLKPGRSLHDLSYSKIMTCDMGQLIPVMCDEVLPGDKWKIGADVVLRFMPTTAPLLHQVDLYTHYFFVPYRLLWDDWEIFITGDVGGDDASTLPRWNTIDGGKTETQIGTLWDFLGFPVDTDPDGAYPIDFPRRAYYAIWNEYYRDETLQAELDITDQSNYEILYRNWSKDKFTSAMTDQQRGTAPALPISGTTSAVWPAISAANNATMAYDTATVQPFNAGTKNTLENNTIDLSSATTFDIADLRLSVQIQKWMERNQRAGVRYPEFLYAHWGVSPRDERLQRPEYIGGFKSPVVFSEVLQTESSDASTALGTMGGHGIGVASEFAGQYFSTEYGLIMGIMSVMPVPMYHQGINRQWLRETRYDFPSPEWMHLSEQAIIRAELYANDVEADNQTIFGYNGAWDELRVKDNMVVSQMHDTFDYWHICRQFAGAPTLVSAFISTEDTIRKDMFAVPSDPGLLISFGNRIKAIRPIPQSSEPGLMDHF